MAVDRAYERDLLTLTARGFWALAMSAPRARVNRAEATADARPARPRSASRLGVDIMGMGGRKTGSPTKPAKPVINIGRPKPSKEGKSNKVLPTARRSSISSRVTGLFPQMSQHG
mmetsp:Transcript_62255/g.197026  ORF Transcript_62255/g.197026 Transcript_62255/m.197026 type:complete len:115 (-) Transcript_62255:450-794(-)